MLLTSLSEVSSLQVFNFPLVFSFLSSGINFRYRCAANAERDLPKRHISYGRFLFGNHIAAEERLTAGRKTIHYVDEAEV